MFRHVPHASFAGGLVVLACSAAAVSAPAALATPPPISQYIEQIPTASGPRPARQEQQQQQQQQQQKQKQSTQAQAQAQSPSAPGSLPTPATGTSNQLSVPHATTRLHHQAGTQQIRPAHKSTALGVAFSSDDSGGVGRGVLLAIALSAVTALAMGGFVLRRH